MLVLLLLMLYLLRKQTCSGKI